MTVAAPTRPFAKPTAAEPLFSATVKDVIENRGRFSKVPPPGLVVIFEWPSSRGWLPLAGDQVELAAEGREPVTRPTHDLKDHGPSVSLYFIGLTRADVPIGSKVTWSRDRHVPRREAARGTLVPDVQADVDRRS